MLHGHYRQSDDKTEISDLPCPNTRILQLVRAGGNRFFDRPPSQALNPRAMTRLGLESTEIGTVPPHFSDTSPR